MSSELNNWLGELVLQQRCRDERITEAELAASWDRYLDARLDAEKERAMTADDHPAGEPLGRHVVPLISGEIVSVTVDDGSVLVALYAVPEAGSASAADTVLPAQAMRLMPGEAEMVSGLIGYAAVTAYGNLRRPLTEPVDPSTGQPGGQDDASG
jgi:hypothetical protein